MVGGPRGETDLRHRRRRLRAGRARDGGLCRVRRPVGRRCWTPVPIGGQAGASARIENYLGFPTGISGQALAGRAFSQAQKFGAEIMIPVSARSLDCERRDGAFALMLESGDELRVARRRGGERRALPAAGDRESRPVRGPRRLVLGFAGRSAALRRPGRRACRRRQFGGTGRRVPVRPCAQGLHGDPRRRPRRQHVALSDRAHRGDAEHRIDLQCGSDRARGHAGRFARARALEKPAVDEEEHLRQPQSFPVRRRRSRHRLARRLRRHARPRRLRRHRARSPSSISDGRSRRWKPRCPACSPSATCVLARSSVWVGRSGRVHRSSPRCTAISAMPPSLRSNSSSRFQARM